jgi:PIN like domain
LKVFLDNNLSPYLALALSTLLEPEGDQVVHLRDRFAHDTEDRVWIEALSGEGGWLVISADRRIHCVSAWKIDPGRGVIGVQI